MYYYTRLLISRYWFIACFFIALASCLVCDFYLARVNIVNSDLVQTYNEVLAVRSGNILLNHWVLSADNFYFTDLLPAVILSFFVGTTTNLVYIAPYVVFCLLLFGCLLIVDRAAETTRQRHFGLFSVLFLLGLPYGPDLNLFLLSDIHTGTIMCCIFAAFFAQPALSGKRFNRITFIPFFILVFCITASDPMGDIFFCVPLLIIIIVRLWLWPRAWLDELALFGCTFAGICMGLGFIAFLKHNHGFTTSTLYISEDLTTTKAGLEAGVHAVVRGLQILFSARAILLGGFIAGNWIAATRLFSALVVVTLCLWVLLNMPHRRSAGLIQCLVAGACFLVLADVCSAAFAIAIFDGPQFPGPAVRYLHPIYVLASIVAIVEAQRLVSRIKSPRLWQMGCVAAAIITIPYLFGAIQMTIRVAQQRPGIRESTSVALADWLLRHGFTRGVGDYWTSGMVIAESRSRILSLPIELSNGKLVVLPWNCDMSLFQKIGEPQFVAFQASNLYGINLSTIASTYGAPIQTYDVAGYVVVEMTKPN
jgi:hypothetical protein